MLRLDPAHPPVWRSATSLQFGLDAVVRIDSPEPWQERLVRALEGGVPEPAFDGTAAGLGAPSRAARDFLSVLAPALLPDARPRRPRVVLDLPDPPQGADPDATAAVAAGLRAAGLTLTAGDRARSAPVVLLACHAVDPRRLSALMSRDIPHVPIVFTAGRAEVGPVVRPGHSACLTCLQLHRRDGDAAWPLLFAQLLDRRAIPVPAALALEAAITAARLLSDAGRTMPPGRSVTLDAATPRRRWRAHRPHADCRCRSLAGISTASARDDRPIATTTRTATARRA